MSCGRAKGGIGPTGTAETSKLEDLRKDHRGLRRRPLFTPLAIFFATILAALVVGAWLASAWGSTTIVLVRHAEKLGQDSDPGLSAVGQARAERLAQMLGGANLKAVYVSDARRTLDTAAPVAAAAGVEARRIPAADLQQLLRQLKNRHRGEVVLVVGHSNTVPAIADGLGAPIGPIDESEYSGLWIVSYSKLRGTRLLALRY